MLIPFGSLQFLVLILLTAKINSQLDEFDDISSPSVPTKQKPISTREDKLIEDSSVLKNEDQIKSANPGGSRKFQFQLTSKSILGSGDYTVELFFIFLMAMWILNYFWGLGINKRLVDEWMVNNGTFLESQFESVGPGATANEIQSSAQKYFYFVQAPNQMSLFLSGRRNCIGMYVELLLRPRQDILLSLYEIVMPGHDIVSIEVVLPSLPDADPCTLAVCPKGKLADVRSAHKAVQ
eukprot:gene6907-14020_t